MDGLKPEDAEEEPAAEVDCCDGIDDGNLGVLAQLALPYLVQSALDCASEEEVRQGRHSQTLRRRSPRARRWPRSSR